MQVTESIWFKMNECREAIQDNAHHALYTHHSTLSPIKMSIQAWQLTGWALSMQFNNDDKKTFKKLFCIMAQLKGLRLMIASIGGGT